MRPGRIGSPCSLALQFVLCVVSISAPRAVLAQAAPSSVPVEVITQHDVPMTTRDGVVLYADIYRPKSADKLPVILMRAL